MSPSTTGEKARGSDPAGLRRIAAITSSGGLSKLGKPWIGLNSPCRSRIASSESERHPSTVGSIPSAAAKRRPISSAPATGRSPTAPEWEMTPWNRPCARGDASRVSTLPPPADCPPIVTRDGSPPKPRMLSLTHSSAAIWSSTPRLAGAPSIHP